MNKLYESVLTDIYKTHYFFSNLSKYRYSYNFYIVSHSIPLTKKFFNTYYLDNTQKKLSSVLSHCNKETYKFPLVLSNSNNINQTQFYLPYILKHLPSFNKKSHITLLKHFASKLIENPSSLFTFINKTIPDPDEKFHALITFLKTKNNSFKESFLSIPDSLFSFLIQTSQSSKIAEDRFLSIYSSYLSIFSKNIHIQKKVVDFLLSKFNKTDPIVLSFSKLSEHLSSKLSGDISANDVVTNYLNTIILNIDISKLSKNYGIKSNTLENYLTTFTKTVAQANQSPFFFGNINKDIFTILIQSNEKNLTQETFQSIIFEYIAERISTKKLSTVDEIIKYYHFKKISNILPVNDISPRSKNKI